MSSDLLCQVKPIFGRVAVGDLPKIENPKNPDEYSYPQIAKVAVRKGFMSVQVEEPRLRFGKLVYGVTINGQTFWVGSQTEIDKLIKEMEGK